MGPPFDEAPADLAQLAHRGDGEVVVARLHSPAGASDVAAPRVVLHLGALDHQELRLAIGSRPQGEQDRRAAHRTFDIHRATWIAGQ